MKGGSSLLQDAATIRMRISRKSLSLLYKCGYHAVVGLFQGKVSKGVDLMWSAGIRDGACMQPMVTELH